MSQSNILKIEDIPVVARGDGVETTLLVGKDRFDEAPFTSGFTQFPVGKKVPFHSHNCGEMVTLLEGEALVEIEGEESVEIKRYDTTFVPANRSHRFVNIGDTPMKILWVYGTDYVTRTFTETGETVVHLSSGDKVDR